jgi:hypothetical protein
MERGEHTSRPKSATVSRGFEARLTVNITSSRPAFWALSNRARQFSGAPCIAGPAIASAFGPEIERRRLDPAIRVPNTALAGEEKPWITGSRSGYSTVCVMAGQQTGDEGPGYVIEDVKDLVDLRSARIGDKDDVFVANRKPVGDKVGASVGKIEPVDNR